MWEVSTWGFSTRMDGRCAGEQSYSIWIDEADDEGAEAVGVEGADGYEWRQSTYVI